ncbi:hypothetical protein [Haloarcula onubensis]|uniref:Uncharacterized protein n=1 Tax=Haloarcula onubensis TaxID=2950539 RepID=A0ABU2FK75_9EURY|nr:hypothetical protein [Halomicroarcula sp. S3CR25-11]MDS0281154.1 hypothetical protein [Halomicroarcula sp. S3CR25-11]
MTESEQAKAALAALAAGESAGQSGSGTSGTTGRARGDSCESATDGPATPPGLLDSDHVADIGPDADYRTVIERAVTATEDLDSAAAFVESVGLDGLEEAVRQAEREVSGLADDGREALATFERFRVAAQGPVEE